VENARRRRKYSKRCRRRKSDMDEQEEGAEEAIGESGRAVSDEAIAASAGDDAAAVV